jgi:hypothetical protein
MNWKCGQCTGNKTQGFLYVSGMLSILFLLWPQFFPLHSQSVLFLILIRFVLGKADNKLLHFWLLQVKVVEKP